MRAQSVSPPCTLYCDRDDTNSDGEFRRVPHADFSDSESVSSASTHSSRGSPFSQSRGRSPSPSSQLLPLIGYDSKTDASETSQLIEAPDIKMIGPPPSSALSLTLFQEQATSSSLHSEERERTPEKRGKRAAEPRLQNSSDTSPPEKLVRTSNTHRPSRHSSSPQNSPTLPEQNMMVDPPVELGLPVDHSGNDHGARPPLALLPVPSPTPVSVP